MARASASGSILKVHSSTSTKTGVAPSSATTSAVAKKVNGGTKTASPGPIPQAIRGMSRASVPEAQITQCLAPVMSARRSSSSRISGPNMNSQCSSTASILARICGSRRLNWDFKSIKSMFLSWGLQGVLKITRHRQAAKQG